MVADATTDDALLRQLVASEGGLIGVTVFGLITAAIAVTGTPQLTRDRTGQGRSDEPATDAHPSTS